MSTRWTSVGLCSRLGARLSCSYSSGRTSAFYPAARLSTSRIASGWHSLQMRHTSTPPNTEISFQKWRHARRGNHCRASAGGFGNLLCPLPSRRTSVRDLRRCWSRWDRLDVHWNTSPEAGRCGRSSVSLQWSLPRDRSISDARTDLGRNLWKANSVGGSCMGRSRCMAQKCSEKPGEKSD